MSVFELKERLLKPITIMIAVAPQNGPDCLTWRREVRAWRVQATHKNLLVTRYASPPLDYLYVVTHHPTGRYIAGGFDDVQRAAAFCSGLSLPELDPLWKAPTIEAFNEAMIGDLEARLHELARAARSELGMVDLREV